MTGRLRLLDGLQLGRKLVDGGDVVEAGEIGVAGQGFTLFAVDQNLHFQDAGDIGREGVDERGDGEVFHQNAGAVVVGKGVASLAAEAATKKIAKYSKSSRIFPWRFLKT